MTQTLLNIHCSLFHVSRPNLFQTDIEIEGYHLSMEIDTGAAVSIISDRTHTRLPYLGKLLLQATQLTL